MFNGPFQKKNTFLHNKSLSVTNINLLDTYIYIYIYNDLWLFGKQNSNLFYFFFYKQFQIYLNDSFGWKYDKRILDILDSDDNFSPPRLTRLFSLCPAWVSPTPQRWWGEDGARF